MRRSVILAGAWCVLALNARADQVTLKNGDRLTGSIVKADEKTMLIKTELAGDVNVEWRAVTTIVSSQPLSLQLKSGQVVTGRLNTESGRFEVESPSGRAAYSKEEVVAIRNEEEQNSYDRLQHPRLTDLWTGLLDTGLSETRGNSSLLAYNLAAKATRAARRDKLTAYVTAVYATDNTTPPGRTTAHAIQGGARLDFNLTPRTFVFGLADFGYDEFQHLDLRSVFGGGLGVHLIKNSGTTLDVFGGGDYDREKFSPNPPLVLTGVTRNTAETLVGEELSWKVNQRISLDERFSAFPNMSDVGQYRFQFDASAAAKLKNWLSWQITFSDRYLSNPLPGLKSNDQLLSTGLRLNFGKATL